MGSNIEDHLALLGVTKTLFKLLRLLVSLFFTLHIFSCAYWLRKFTSLSFLLPIPIFDCAIALPLPSAYPFPYLLSLPLSQHKPLPQNYLVFFFAARPATALRMCMHVHGCDQASEAGDHGPSGYRRISRIQGRTAGSERQALKWLELPCKSCYVRIIRLQTLLRVVLWHAFVWNVGFQSWPGSVEPGSAPCAASNRISKLQSAHPQMLPNFTPNSNTHSFRLGPLLICQRQHTLISLLS